MKVFFRRMGGKARLLKVLLPMIPAHKKYVELFVGSGAVLYGKEKSEIEIINDLDELITDGFELLKNANPNVSDYKILTTVDDIQEFVNKEAITKEDKLMKHFHILTNTYCCLGKGKIFARNSGKRKLQYINEYIERLKDVIICNKDYKLLLKEHDSEDTFFFLDPPYENSVLGVQLYKHSYFDYEQLRDELKTIKGKFLLTLNDSEYIRELYKEFNIQEISVDGYVRGFKSGKKKRAELAITNYNV